MDECRLHDLAEEIVCLHEQLVRLARESYDHVDAEEYFRPSLNLGLLPDILDFTGKCSCIITTSHFTQYGIASRLERDMVMWQELGSGCDPIDHFLCKKVRFDRRYPVSFDAFHIIQLPDQLEECLSCRLSEISGIDSCEHDLLDTFSRYRFCLRNDFRNRYVAAFASCVWNRAVMTFIVTSVLNLEEGTRPFSA